MPNYSEIGARFWQRMRSLLLRYKSNNVISHVQPKNRHTHRPKPYRISRAAGKSMTKVADELISFGYKHLKNIYENIDDR